MKSREGLRVWVPGDPAPQGSKIAGQRKDGGLFVRESSKRLAAWRDCCIWTFKSQRVRLTGEVGATLRFQYMRDADIDKLARAVLDSLTYGNVIEDDRFVTDLLLNKRKALSLKQAGCYVEVYQA